MWRLGEATQPARGRGDALVSEEAGSASHENASFLAQDVHGNGRTVEGDDVEKASNAPAMCCLSSKEAPKEFAAARRDEMGATMNPGLSGTSYRRSVGVVKRRVARPQCDEETTAGGKRAGAGGEATGWRRDIGRVDRC